MTTAPMGFVLMRPGTWNNFEITPELIEHVRNNSLTPIAVYDSLGKGQKFCGWVLDMTVENGDLVGHCELDEKNQALCDAGCRPCAVITTRGPKTEIRECFVSTTPVFK